MNQRPDIHGTREELVAFIADQQAEIGRLREALEEYACTGTDHPCGCYDLLSKEKTEIKWLRAALQRIVDNGEQSGFAYGVAFAALRASKEELDDLPRTAG